MPAILSTTPVFSEAAPRRIVVGPVVIVRPGSGFGDSVTVDLAGRVETAMALGCDTSEGRVRAPVRRASNAPAEVVHFEISVRLASRASVF